MKKTIILIGLLGLVCICGLCLFVNHVQADNKWIGYNPTTKIVTFGDWEQANETQAFDALIDANALYGWNVLNYSSKQDRVMVFNATTFLGIVIGNASYDIVTPYVGDPTFISFENDTFICNGNGSIFMNFLYVVNNGHLRTGRLINESRKETDNGCTIYFHNYALNSNAIAAGISGIADTANQDCFIYSTTIYASSSVGSCGIFLSDLGYANNSFYNCFFRGCGFTQNGQFKIYNVQLENSVSSFSSCAGLLDKIAVRTMSSYFFEVPSVAPAIGFPTDYTIYNSFITNVTYVASSAWGRGASATPLYLIDCQTDNGTWNMYYKAKSGISVCTTPISRNYTLNGRLVWLTGGNASSVGVKCYLSDGSLRFSTTTDSSGVFPQQDVLHTKWTPLTTAAPWVTITYYYPQRLVFYNVGTGYEYSNFSLTIDQKYNSTWCIENQTNISFTNNIVHATGTNETSFSRLFGYTVFNNWTGNISGLVLIQNIVNAVGSHEYNWNPLLGVNGEWWVWANYTGIGGGSSGTNFSMINPNPANNTFTNGSYINNNLSVRSGGENTCVDVTYANFTDTPENLTTTISSINSNTTDGLLYNLNVDYLTCRNAVSCSAVIDSFAYVTIGQLNIPLYKCFRGGLMFDTRVIPSNAIIDSLSLNFTLYYYDSDRDFSLIIQNGQPIYPHEPMLISDYDLTKYSNDGGSFNTALLPTVCNPFSIILNNTGIGWINKSGITKLMIRSSEDINSIVPSTEYIQLYLSDFFGGHEEYKPHLFITYHLPVNWSRVVNLTFYDNATSDGHWVNRTTIYVVENGTVCYLNTNFSNASTVYWWMVNASINGTQVDSQVFTFTTGNASLIVASTDHRILYLGIGGTLGGVLTMVCIPYIFVRRRRQ